MVRNTNPNQKPVAEKKEQGGSEKARKKRLIEKDDAKQAENASKFFKKFAPPSASNPEVLSSEPVATASQSHASNVSSVSAQLEAKDDVVNKISEKIDAQIIGPTENVDNSTNETFELKNCLLEESDLIKDSLLLHSNFDETDPSTWPILLPNSLRNILLTNGPKQKILSNYPMDESLRSFHRNNFQKVSKKSGECTHRDWLLYSEKSNALFCFPCCLFMNSLTKTSPWSNYGTELGGFKDLARQTRGLEIHEESQAHFACELMWKQYVFNAKNKNQIDNKMQDEYHKQVNFWTDVLKGITDAIIFLAKNNLAFLGESTNIEDSNCGNFLSLIQLLSKYNAPLALHLERRQKYQTSYFSPAIQNEFISVIGNSVRRKIIEDIKKRKYFTIMFDATPDKSHSEQVSQVIRTVAVSSKGCFIQENFIDFIHCEGKSGKEISDMILEKLKHDHLDIGNCRGQAYDNGANMSGKYQGVQSRIREINSLAHYIPCASHSLNLVGQNAANRVLPAKLVLGQIQNQFVFFSNSTNRWDMLHKFIKKSLKGNSLTRWSARADAVTTMYEEFEGVAECLVEMMNSSTLNGQTIADAKLRFLEIWNFKFLLGLTIWDWILCNIEICNQSLQSESCTLDDACTHLNNLLVWLKEFKITGFQKSISKAREKATRLQIEFDSGFDYRNTRSILPRRFKTIDTNNSKSVSMSNEDKFKETFFKALMDELILQFSKRFEEIQGKCDDFGFLWGRKLNSYSDLKFTESVKNLCSKYPEDLNVKRFEREILFLKNAVKGFLNPETNLQNTTAIEILNVLAKHNFLSSMENCQVALRIFLTLPVSLATNERSFSKLKIIKNYLRSSMSQDRLRNLAILSIESDYVQKTSFEDTIKEFASLKCRRVPLSF